MSASIKRLNNILSNYGKADNGIDSKYRLVWSEDMIEKRFGVFNRFDDSGNFIGTDSGVKEVKKYGYINSRWILEIFVPGMYAANDECPLSKFGSYEPIFIFEDKDKNILPVVENVLLKIIQHIENPPKARTEDEIITEMKMKEDKEVAEFVDKIDPEELSLALKI